MEKEEEDIGPLEVGHTGKEKGTKKIGDLLVSKEKTEAKKQVKKDIEILLKRKDKQILYYTAQRLYVEGLHVGEIEEIIKKAMTELMDEAVRLDTVSDEGQ